MKWFLICLLFLIPNILFAGISEEELTRLTNAIIIAKEFIHDYPPDEYKKRKFASLELTKEEENMFCKYTNSYSSFVYLDNMSPAKAVPLFATLWENDAFSDVKHVFPGGRTLLMSEVIYDYLFVKLGILTSSSKSKNITMQWENYYMLTYPKEFVFFWYYAGLKYIPKLLDDWYVCWKDENQRKTPREKAIQLLIQEAVCQYSYHFFPFMAEKIKEGDKSFQPIIEQLQNGGLGQFGTLEHDCLDFNDPDSFVSWWEKNKQDYVIPLPDKKLIDLKYILKRKNKQKFFYETLLRGALESEIKLENYIKSKNRPGSNCWYFSLKEENDSEQ